MKEPNRKCDWLRMAEKPRGETCVQKLRRRMPQGGGAFGCFRIVINSSMDQLTRPTTRHATLFENLGRNILQPERDRRERALLRVTVPCPYLKWAWAMNGICSLCSTIVTVFHNRMMMEDSEKQ